MEKLRSRDYANVDWDNLIEEIEDMGRNERRSLESNLIVVLLDQKPYRSQAPDFSRGEQQIFSSFQAPRFIYGVNPKSKIQNPKSNDLLKWQYRPERRSGSWEGGIIEHCRRIKKTLKESPSLKPYLESIFSESYIEAVKQAKAETGLPLETFPLQCPDDLAALLDDEFLLP